MEFCLDTDVIIEFLKDKGSESSELIQKSKSGIKLDTTSITVYELFYGPMYGGFSKEIDDIKLLLIWLNTLSLDREAAILAAEIDANLHKKGKPVGLRDVIIAAICIGNNVPIVTKNTKHFNIIAKETNYKLKVLTPKEALEEIT